jgi:hypothetical protein
MTQSRDPSKYHRITADTKDAKLIRPQPRETGSAEPGVAAPFKAFAGFLIPGSSPAPPGDVMTIGVINLAGLGIGTPWIVLASATEIIPPNIPHSGAAFFHTLGTLLDQQTETAHVYFRMGWNWPLPVGFMTIIGDLAILSLGVRLGHGGSSKRQQPHRPQVPAIGHR